MRARSMVLGAAFVSALVVTAACPLGDVFYPTTSFRCDPSGDEPRCPLSGADIYQCCSDDPAALDLADLELDALPGFEGRGGSGTPLFAGTHNDAGTSGMCLRVGTVAPARALSDVGAQGCPVPCNPTWDADDIETVCGVASFCCQTTLLDEDDCVFDPGMGDAGCHRPARGDDIAGLDGLELTNWSPAAHATHQDPGGLGCEAFVAGLSSAERMGAEPSAILAACYRRLSVADQRGFCLNGAGIAGCPLAQPSYRDACETLNDEQGLEGCG